MKPIDMLQVNVNDKTEKKNGMTYLSWSWAWGEVLKIDPNANWEVMLFEDKLYNKVPYIVIGDTAMVMVSVTIEGVTRSCQLPVMDNKNSPISVKGETYLDKWGKEKISRVDAFNVNTAIMRCMVKAIALFGLGLYIYSGEDLPEVIEQPSGDTSGRKYIEPPVENPADPKPVPKAVKGKPESTYTEKQANAKAVRAENEAREQPAAPPDEWPDEMIPKFVEEFFKHAALNATQESLVDYAHKNKPTIEKMKAKYPDTHQAFMAQYRALKAKLPSSKE